MWLVLLVPAAQSLALAHPLSHLAAGSSSSHTRDEPQLLHAAGCELCLTSAAVSGGALPTSQVAPPAPAATQQLAPAAAVGVWVSTPTVGYFSRAPPTTLR
jgi:hypothetical protein